MVRVVLWGFAALVLTGSAEVPARAQTVDDPLPDGAVARLGTVRFRQGSSISSLALTAAGKTLASVGSNSEHLAASLWDAPTVGFSADGKQLFLSGLKGIIRIHDCATFQELRRFPTATTSHEFQPAVLSPDGKILAVATTNSMVLWNVATGQALHRELPT